MRASTVPASALFALFISFASASDLTYDTTVFNSNLAGSTIGLRDVGAGNITIDGVGSGTVTQSVLLWHGPTNSDDPKVNAQVNFNGNSITGSNIGFSFDNFWTGLNSQAYKSDVTGYVTKDGVYALSGFQTPGARINGAGLLTFFDSGVAAGKRDFLIFDGNDSNYSNAYDPGGWDFTVPGINYSGGQVFLRLLVFDGQDFGQNDDGTLSVNGTLLASGGLFQGSGPRAAGAGVSDGSLADFVTFDITKFLNPGSNTLHITLSAGARDAVSAVAAIVDVPAGAASRSPLVFTTSVIPGGILNQSYGPFTLAAGGGSGNYSWSGSNLPAGLAISPAGILTGTPAESGLFSNVAIQLKDTTSGETISQTFAINIAAQQPSALTIIGGGDLGSFAPGKTISGKFSARGGTPPYLFTATGLPAGVTFNDEEFTATLTQPGTYSFTVQVTDRGNASASTIVRFSVFEVTTTFAVTGGPLPDTTINIPYTQTLSATGGASPYNWTVAAGSLPDGLSFLPSGEISGTPTRPGSFAFSARATDSTGASAVGSFSVTIAPLAVNITTPSPLSSGMVDVDYPVQVITASGGIAPYTFEITEGSLPAGLTFGANGAIAGVPESPGQSTFTVTATDVKGTKSSATLVTSVRPFSADLILSAGNLSFSIAAGASGLPDSKPVQVQSTDVSTPLTYSTAIAPAASWLSVSRGGATPGSFNVSLTSAALSLAASETPYETTVVVACIASSPCAGSSLSIRVLLQVKAAPPLLTFINDLLSFATTAENPQSSEQTLGIQNTGGGTIDITSVTCPAVWCKVGSTPRSLASGVVGSLTVRTDPTGLAPGYYYSNLTIVSNVGTTVVPVTFFIATITGISLAPSGVQFTMPEGGAPALPETSFRITISGSPLRWDAQILPGAPWLQLGPHINPADGSPGVVNFSVDKTIAATLAPKAYYGTIRITSHGAANTPQDFQVILNVTAAVSRQKPDPAPGGLVFVSPADATTPPPQTVQIFASSVPPVTYQASAATTTGDPWLSVEPVIGTASVSSPGKATVTVNPTGLAPGVYHGSVSYSSSASGVRSVNVTYIVAAPPVSSQARQSTRFRAAADAGSCVPTQLVPTQTGLVSNFAAPASWPTPLEIRLVNDCGDPVANGQIVATFSNADPPLSIPLADPATAVYSGTWTPRHTTPQVTITASATAPGFAPAVAQIGGAVVPNDAPVLTQNGILHIFAPQVGAPLAPGTTVQIYGSSLASQTIVNSTIPLPTTLGGTSIIIGGLLAPLSFVSPGQVNAQIPFELAPGKPYQVIVSANGGVSTPDNFQVSVVSPGVNAFPSGLANAQHNDGRPITEASPAAPSEFIVIYLAGMGSTDVPVASGAAAPSDPLARAQNPPSITINSEPVPFVFAGLTPGLAGLYQINLQVPADANDGDLPLVVTQAGVPGTTVLVPVHR